MSHIPIHLITQRAAARIGRIEQVRALAPFPDRHAGDHWQLNRAARIRGNYRQQIRPEKIELGETIVYESPREVGAPTLPAPAPRAPAGIGGGQRITYRLGCFITRAVGGRRYSWITTPTHPYPWRIVQLQWAFYGTLAGEDTVDFGLFSSEQDEENSTAEPSYDPLILTRQTSNYAENNTTPDSTRLPLSAASILGSDDPITGGFAGAEFSANKAFGMVVLREAGSAENRSFEVLLTIEILGASAPAITIIRRSPTYIAGAAEARAAEARAPTAAPGAPALVSKPAVACTPAYVFINHGAAYNAASSNEPGSAWQTQALDLLQSTQQVCGGDVQQINDEMARVTRNFGGSLGGRVPLQIAALIDFYRRTLVPLAQRSRARLA